jgi:hypothetical protein
MFEQKGIPMTHLLRARHRSRSLPSLWFFWSAQYFPRDEAKWYAYALGIPTGKQSRPKISSQIDGVSRFPSERRSNTEDEEEKADWC